MRQPQAEHQVPAPALLAGSHGARTARRSTEAGTAPPSLTREHAVTSSQLQNGAAVQRSTEDGHQEGQRHQVPPWLGLAVQWKQGQEFELFILDLFNTYFTFRVRIYGLTNIDINK